MVSYKEEALKLQKELRSMQENIDKYNIVKDQLENSKKEVSRLIANVDETKIELAEH